MDGADSWCCASRGKHLDGDYRYGIKDRPDWCPLGETPEWISVEKPPENDRNIFICHGSADFKAPCIGYYDPDMKLFYEDKNWFASPIYDAMFWCEMPELPVPEPPKERKKE